MIRYALRCSEGHVFDSWFGSSDDFEKLQGRGLVACAVCGDAGVEKDLMAPRVNKKEKAKPTLSGPASPAEQALAELRRKIETTSENVGRDFATEARRIHDGDAPKRAIIGEANLKEAKALIDDGIPVAPLPWGKTRAN